MRISDWSSDVCSSDLYLRNQREGSDRGVVPAAIVALRHNHVDAVIDHLLGVLDLADHRHDPGAIGMKAVHPRPGMAEAGGIAWHLFLRSEEHTSELQPLMRISYAVICLKNTNIARNNQDKSNEKQYTQHTPS